MFHNMSTQYFAQHFVCPTLRLLHCDAVVLDVAAYIGPGTWLGWAEGNVTGNNVAYFYR